MEHLLAKYLFAPRAADAGGAGGSGAAAGSGSGGAGAGASSSSQGAGAQAGDKGGAAAAAGAGAAAAGTPYFPEGLGDQFKGKDDRETIDKLNGAVKGYRDRDATRDVPEKVDGYFSLDGIAEDKFKLSDDFKGHFDFLKQDPGAIKGLEVLRAAGVDRAVVLNAVQAMMGGLKEAGMLEPLLDEKAERLALLPETHKTASEADQGKAIEARMTANSDFLKLMTSTRELPKDVAEYVELMTFDSAKGHKFVEWMRGQMTGGGAGPGAHGGGPGGDTADSLRAEMAKPELTPSHPQFDRAKYAEFEARYKAFHSKK